MRVLGIDTSCDDTGVGVVEMAAATGDGGRGTGAAPRAMARVLANVVASQAAVHAPYGGVLPEQASREHLAVLDAVVERALADAGTRVTELDAVAATYGPGLAGALLVGLTYGKALAIGLGVPFVKVHHLEGHVAASVAGGDVAPPFLCLIASGGHTVLFDVPAWGVYRQLGRSRDDAAGEAFDKVARLLGLPYPGGPALAALAGEGDADAVDLPAPLARQEGYDFSFSGLKTAVAVRLERTPDLAPADVAAAFERRAVDHLCSVALRAAADLGRGDLVVAGGVAANARLRATLAAAGLRVFLPPAGLATDNGAMIALAGARRLLDAGADAADLAADATPYLPLAGAAARPRDGTAAAVGTPQTVHD
jgi:N6-L-threonylcarbamoyladenine synthase